MVDILKTLDEKSLDQAKMAVLQEIKRQFGMRAVFECDTDAIIRAVFEATAAISERDKLAEDYERLRAALTPFSKLSFSFDGFDLEPAALVFQRREYGRFRSDDHAAFQRMIDDARAALSSLATAPADDGWKTMESLPKDKLVWCFEPHSMGGFMFAGCLGEDGRWRNNLDGKVQHPTHWRDLPASPSDGEG